MAVLLANKPYLPLLPNHRASPPFTVPRRVEGWVDLGGWLHTGIKWRPRESNLDTVTHPSSDWARRGLTTAAPNHHIVRILSVMSHRQIHVEDNLLILCTRYYIIIFSSTRRYSQAAVALWRYRPIYTCSLQSNEKGNKITQHHI